MLSPQVGEEGLSVSKASKRREDLTRQVHVRVTNAGHEEEVPDESGQALCRSHVQGALRGPNADRFQFSLQILQDGLLRSLVHCLLCREACKSRDGLYECEGSPSPPIRAILAHAQNVLGRCVQKVLAHLPGHSPNRSDVTRPHRTREDRAMRGVQAGCLRALTEGAISSSSESCILKKEKGTPQSLTIEHAKQGVSKCLLEECKNSLKGVRAHRLAQGSAGWNGFPDG